MKKILATITLLLLLGGCTYVAISGTNTLNVSNVGLNVDKEFKDILNPDVKAVP